MSTRDENREWLLADAQKYPDGWAAINIDTFGLEGSLDLLELTSVGPYNVDFRHSPFRRDPELKALVQDARVADMAVGRRVYELQNAAWNRARAS